MASSAAEGVESDPGSGSGGSGGGGGGGGSGGAMIWMTVSLMAPISRSRGGLSSMVRSAKRLSSWRDMSAFTKRISSGLLASACDRKHDRHNPHTACK